MSSIKLMLHIEGEYYTINKTISEMTVNRSLLSVVKEIKKLLEFKFVIDCHFVLLVVLYANGTLP